MVLILSVEIDYFCAQFTIMKNLSIIFSSLALIGVFALIGLRLTDKKASRSNAARNVPGQGVPAGGRIAYVNIDTLEAHYDFFKAKKAEFEARQKSIDAELEKNAAGLQSDYEALRKKAQEGSLSQTEGEAAQQRLVERQQDLELKRQNLSEKFLKDREEFNKQIHTDLNAYIKEYNEDKGYDIIFTYTEDGTMLYVNPEYDITQDIIDGMNKKKGTTASSK